MQSFIRVFAFLSALVLLGGCAPSNQARPNTTVTRTLDKTLAIPPDTRVSVQNLAGHVRISQGGPRLQVTATVVAGGKDQASARALADTNRLDVRHSHNQILLHVDYPVDRHDSYQYIPTHPEQQAHGGVHVLGFDMSFSSSSLTYQDRTVRVYQGKSGGVPLHVDLNVKLPAGTHAELANHVGRIQAQNLKNTLVLRTDSGDISTRAITGDLSVTSGSGDIRLADQHGSTGVHTGSGDVTARGITGAVDLHTGSGDIKGRALHGDSLAMETGSGDIDLQDIGGALKLETGSGDITLNGIRDVSNARIQCGSGDILMRGNLSGMQTFDMHTGSGDVTLITSNPPAVHLDIHASDINPHWPDIRNAHTGRRRFSGDIGAASGQGRIRTGSGDVTLKQ